MLFLFRSAPEVEKRIHSKLFRKFWRSRGTKEPAHITVTSPSPLPGCPSTTLKVTSGGSSEPGCRNWDQLIWSIAILLTSEALVLLGWALSFLTEFQAGCRFSCCVYVCIGYTPVEGFEYSDKTVFSRPSDSSQNTKFCWQVRKPASVKRKGEFAQ